MLGRTGAEWVESALLLGPLPVAEVAGEPDDSCDPFYRAWLRAQRRGLARAVLSLGDRAAGDLSSARIWVASGEWGDTAQADLDLLTFDQGIRALLARQAAEAVAGSADFSEACAALRLLDECYRVHHAFEELLMELHEHPGRAGHEEAHRSIQAQLGQLRAVHARGDLAAAQRVLGAMRDRSDEHAAGPDRSLQRALLEVRP
jgi:hemerythrin